MRSIDSVAVVGAGALGVMYLDSLAVVPGLDAYFAAGPDRAVRLAAQVFSVNGAERRFPVRAFGSGPAPDLVLLSVKNYDLPGLLPEFPGLCGPETLLVSVLNGIDSEEVLEAALPGRTVLRCCVLGMDAVKEGPRVGFSRRGAVLLGSLDPERRESCEAVAALLRRAGLDAQLPEDIMKSIWWKWMINIGANQVSAAAGAPYGALRSDPDLVALMESAMREVIALARAEGIGLGEEDLKSWYPVLASLGAGGKTSMLQDVEARRATEIETFAGKLVERSARAGLDAPVNHTLYRLLKARERLYAAGT